MWVRDALTPADLDEFRSLVREYAAALEIGHCFITLEDELSALPGAYGSPGGALLIGGVTDETSGCVALRPLSATDCEMKRLYVRAGARGSGLSQALVRALLDRARSAGYSAMCLHTLPARMPAAARLYASFGFRSIPPYEADPVPGSAYFRLTW